MKHCVLLAVVADGRSSLGVGLFNDDSSECAHGGINSRAAQVACCRRESAMRGGGGAGVLPSIVLELTKIEVDGRRSHWPAALL